MKRIIFLLMLALCSPVIAGPFGFQMGMSIDYISRNIKLKPGNGAGWYRSDSTLVEGLVFHGSVAQSERPSARRLTR